ncbi:MAG: DUF4350 domain-containing protein [Pseudomonadota bacterium]
MSRNSIILAIAALLVASCVYVFLLLFERYEKSEDVGWDSEAKRKPFLAAEQFLERQEITVSSIQSLEKLADIASYDTIFIAEDSTIVGQRHIARLIQWLNNGGHLIVAGRNDEAGATKLLERFDIFIDSSECGCDDDVTELFENFEEKKASEYLREEQARHRAAKDSSPANAENDEGEPEIDESSLTTLSFGDIPHDLKIRFAEDTIIDHDSFYEDADPSDYPAFYWRGNDNEIHFAQFDIGEGLLSVTAGDRIWRSNKIDEFDHAYLWWILAANSNQVAMITSAQIPSLLQLMRRYAPEAVLVAGLWLLAWLVYRSRRFGPIIEPKTTTRRSINEHLYASAAFLWKEKQYESLIEPLKTNISDRIRMLFPGFEGLTEQEQIARIAEFSTLSIAEVNRAWQPTKVSNDSEFQNIVSILQKIRESL